jgi:rhodanese-related sulfurtransferase
VAANELPIEIAPVDVRDLLKSGEPVRLVDVREPQEHAICHIDGARLIPMQTVPQHLQELDDDGPRIIVFCHHGMRSLSVVDWLRRQGVANCQSMAGGIDRWSLEIDLSVPRY